MTRKNIPIRKPERPRVNLSEVVSSAVLGAKQQGDQPLSFPEGQKLPFMPGATLRTSREQKDLQALGVSEGKALPGDFAEKLAAMRRAQAEELHDAIKEAARSGKKLKLPSTIEIADLSPERQAELRADIAKAQNDWARLQKLREQQAEMASLSPSIQAAMSASAPGVEVFDSREDQPVPADAPDDAPHASPPPPAEDPGDTTPFETGATSIPHNCPRCNHPVNEPPDIHPTREDIIAFENNVASYDAKPFLKSYSLFGGHINVVFRTPTRLATVAVQKAYRIDRESGAFGTPEEGYIRLDDYLTAISLHSLTANGDTYAISDDVDAAMNADASLQDIHYSLQTAAPLSNASLWRAIRAHWRQFDSLVQYMEANAPNPSFWRATGV